MPDLDHLRIDGTTYDLKDSTAREKNAVQDNELDSLKSALTQVKNTVNRDYYITSANITKSIDPSTHANTGKYYLTDTLGIPYTDALVDHEGSIYCDTPLDIAGISGTLTMTLSAVGQYHASSNRKCLFTDANGLVIFRSDGEKNLFVDSGSGTYVAVFNIPTNAAGFVWSLAGGATIASIDVVGFMTSSTTPNDAIVKNYDIYLPWNETKRLNKYYARGELGKIYTEALTTNGNYMYSERPIDVSDYVGCTITITLSAVGSGHSTAGGGACLFVDSTGHIIYDTVSEKDLYIYDSETGKYTATITIPNGACGFLWAMQNTNTVESMRVVGVISNTAETQRRVAYVATTGDDVNAGAYDSPLATVTKALELGYRDIRLMGGIYEQIIDLRQASADDCDIKISAVEHNDPVVFTPPYNIAKITSATIHSGTIYKATISKTILSGCNYIYQDGTEDPETAIPISDLHPAQRGNHYRCPDIVRIAKAESLAEVEESENCLWYLDGTTLYFRAPSAPSSSKPIVYAHTEAVKLFVVADTVSIEPTDNPAHKLCVELNGIETRFMQLNLQCLQTAIARNCRSVASPVWTGISLNRTQYAELVNCEACCANIDGIGGQNINTTINNAEAHNSFSKILNCWSHDNYDDGYSEHDRSESIIIGGLFEWNGKAGVTPSYGEVCTCIDVYSRHNYQGFALVGTVGATGHISGRNGSTLLCYGCISDANNRGTLKKGFVVSGEGNAAIFVNCVAMNELRGFCALGTVHMKLINCSTVSCDTAKYTEGTPAIEIVNGTPVT